MSTLNYIETWETIYVYFMLGSATSSALKKSDKNTIPAKKNVSWSAFKGEEEKLERF